MRLKRGHGRRSAAGRAAVHDCGLGDRGARDESGKALTTSLQLLDRIDTIRLGRWIYGRLTMDEGQTCLS